MWKDLPASSGAKAATAGGLFSANSSTSWKVKAAVTGMTEARASRAAGCSSGNRSSSSRKASGSSTCMTTRL
jgi:hypothetical protein